MKKEPKVCSEALPVLQRLSVAMRSEWQSLVNLAEYPEYPAFAEFLCHQTGSSAESIQRKLTAIRFHLLAGIKSPEIVSWGQEKTLSLYQQNTRTQRQIVQLGFSISRDLHALVMQDLERIRKVLDLGEGSENLWEFLHSVLADVSDQELLHLAGEWQGAKGTAKR